MGMSTQGDQQKQFKSLGILEICVWVRNEIILLLTKKIEYKLTNVYASVKSLFKFYLAQNEIRVKQYVLIFTDYKEDSSLINYSFGIENKKEKKSYKKLYSGLYKIKIIKFLYFVII